MKKIFSVSMALLLFAAASLAQLSYGPKVGVNYMNNQSDAFKLGFHLGGFADYSLGGHISSVGELCFSSKGYKTDSSTQSLNYLDIPLMMQLKIDMSSGAGDIVSYNDNKSILSLIQFGIQFSFLTSAKTQNNVTSMTSKNNSSFRPLDISIPLGLVYQVHSFLLGLRGILSFKNIYTSDPILNPDSRIGHTFGFQGSVGWKFSEGGSKEGHRH